MKNSFKAILAVIVSIVTFGRIQMFKLQGDRPSTGFFTGDMLGESVFKYNPLTLGDLVDVEIDDSPLSDLDGDPLGSDNYIDAEFLEADIYSRGEGALFSKLKEKRAARKAARAARKGKGPSVSVKPSANASGAPTEVVNAAIENEVNNIKAMDAVPGSRLSKNFLLPFLSQNGAVDAPPTAVPMSGQDVFAALTRYQTTYPASSVQKTTVSTGATITFTWTDADFTGGIGATPVVILSHSASALNAASGSKYTVTVTAYDETGKALTIAAWAYRRKLSNDRVLVYLIPYVEVASKLYPVIIKVASGKSCVIAVTGVPVDESVSSIFPGTNHADFLAFKDLIQVK